MVDLLTLADLISVYPSSDSPQIQTLLSAKKEFADLASSITEPIPSRGSYFRHQQLVVRLMLILPALILFHRTGTGKTCTFVAFAEYVRRLYDEGKGNIKRVYVIEPPSLNNEFRHQLVCRCTDGRYETDLVKNATTEAGRKGNITREIKKWYSVKSYTKFANKVEKTLPDGTVRRLTDQQIRDKFSDCLFFIDEVHNLRNISKGEADDSPDVDQAQDRNTDEGEINRIYRQIWRVLHVAERTKVIMGSATLAINDANEIKPVFNLILPANFQMTEAMDLNKMTLAEVEPYFRGKISYVRELDTGARPEYMGDPLNTRIEIDGREVDTRTPVYATEMGSYQAKGYALALAEPGAFRKNERQASNFVFPDHSYGKAGFTKYVRREGDRYRLGAELKQWIRSPDHFRQLSMKFWSIVQTVTKEPGVAFCYTDFVTGSGAILLGLCMEEYGLSEFNETTSVFVGGSGELASYCSSDNPNRRLRLEKKPRYIVISREITDVRLAIVMEVLHSRENKNGEYIKAVIGSPMTREGFNINNGMQFHLVGPTWSPSDAYQALSRILRSTSHQVLLQDARDRLISEGKDPALAVVDVKIYQHASLYPANPGQSVDIQMYQINVLKDRSIRRVERMMKQCAVDCQIHYQRNVRPSDVDGSAVCDYEQCRYTCVDPLPLEVDVSTYDINYAGELISQVIDRLTALFNQQFETTLEQLYDRFSTYRPKFIQLAVEQMINAKMPVTDRFGLISYLAINGSTVYLQREYPVNVPRPEDYYNQLYDSMMVLTETIPANQYLSQIQEIQSISASDPDFETKLAELTIDNRVSLLETAYLENNQPMIDRFQPYLFTLDEPTVQIRLSRESLLNKSKGPGRKPKTQLVLNEPVGESEPVVLHNLYGQSFDLVSYRVGLSDVKPNSRLRILKPSENLGWRDVNEYELPVYNNYLQRLQADKLAKYADRGVYGKISKDKKFRLVNPKISQSGKVCTSWPVDELVDLLWESGVEPPSRPPESMETMANYVGQKMKRDVADYSEERLFFYYSWNLETRANICRSLEKFMADNDRLFQG